MDNQIETLQPDSKNRKNRTFFVILVLSIIVVIGAIFGWNAYQEKQEEKQKEKLKKEYAQNLAEISVDMYVEFLVSSLVVSYYSEVWDNAIDNRKDFNIALNEYRSKKEVKEVIEDTEEGKEKIRDNMKTLQNPPDAYKDSYLVLKQMYGTYIKMVDQAISPTGSLLEFNKKINNLSSDYEQQKEEFLITIPADIKKLRKKIEEQKKKEEQVDKL